eukprot:SAG25_NODE_916_length_4775_cov_8.131737_1_plen_107_part_00
MPHAGGKPWAGPSGIRLAIPIGVPRGGGWLLNDRQSHGDLDPAKGKMSRPFADYLSTIGKSLGLRASTLTYAEFCGFQNSNSESGKAKGDRGAVFTLARGWCHKAL